MIQATKTKSPTREEYFTSLYIDVFPDVARYIGKRGGSLEDAREIFQETLVQYYEQVTVDHPSKVHNPKAYIFGIARHLWTKLSGETRSKTALIAEIEPNDHDPETPSRRRLFTLLNSAGQKCLELLEAFYYQKQTMEQLAGTFGFRSARSATVRKFKCLEKLRNTVKEKSLEYADFTE